MKKVKPTILIVEDFKEELAHCLRYAKSLGFEAFGCDQFETAKQFLEKKRVDILLVDLFLSKAELKPQGIDLITLAIAKHLNIIPIIMSSCPDANLYRQAMNAGALYAIKKPIIHEDEIVIAIKAAKEKKYLLLEKNVDLNVENYSAQLKLRCSDGILLEEKTQKYLEILSKNPKIPCLIYGETGTGKEELAKLIHKKRQKQEGFIPFKAVNCALLNNDIAESLLFGHKRGAFSGADTTKPGLIAEANGGILFLDEIHTLSLKCQFKLLRVLHDGSYSMLGDTEELKSYFQVIVASSRDLDEAIDEGTFLLDLRSRLTGIDLSLLPLRERKDDIPLLVELFFLKQKVETKGIDLATISKHCQKFYWQGNIRQLFQALQAMVAISLADGRPPHVQDMPLLKTMKAPSAKRKKILFSSFYQNF